MARGTADTHREAGLHRSARSVISGGSAALRAAARGASDLDRDLDEAEPDGDRRGLGPAGRVELAQDVRDVDPGGVLADEQPLGDLAVRQAGRDVREDLPLAGRQPEPVRVRARRRQLQGRLAASRRSPRATRRRRSRSATGEPAR